MAYPNFKKYATGPLLTSLSSRPSSKKRLTTSGRPLFERTIRQLPPSRCTSRLFGVGGDTFHRRSGLLEADRVGLAAQLGLVAS